MEPLYFDIAHMLAGGLVLVSFIMLYQDRMFGMLNIFALHASVLCSHVTAPSSSWPSRSPGRRSSRTRRTCT